MRTVRTKLVALVLACVAPAIAGAVLRSRESEHEMLGQVERRVNATNRRFGSELEEYQANARLAITLTQHSARFQQALFQHDAAPVERMVKRLAAVYDDRMILAADEQGLILARGNADNGPKSLGPEASPAFAELGAGKSLSGLFPIQFADGPGYALVIAEPVKVTEMASTPAPNPPVPTAPGPHAASGKKARPAAPPAPPVPPASAGPARPVAPLGTHVGSIVLITRVTQKYLGYLEPKLNADLSIRVNGKLVAVSPDHPGPDLVSDAEMPVLSDVKKSLFA
ncbi:MAG TPA: hypothetical protein VGQ57_06790, partial [Polyangiaceae bacterium]|nr:hypothetical protein [Polyangiaceae bacterium]